MRFLVALSMLFITTQANSTVIYDYQVDRIQVPIDAYTNVGDFYSLSITGPITSTVSINLTSNAGCNLCNAIVQWGTAINNDPIMSSFLTATYDVWDGVSVLPFGSGTIADYDASIYLTANSAGIEFFSDVSVLSLTGTPKTNPLFSDLSVSVTTTTPAQTSSVPEPATLALMSLGLVGLGFSRKRNKS